MKSGDQVRIPTGGVGEIESIEHGIANVWSDGRLTIKQYHVSTLEPIAPDPEVLDAGATDEASIPDAPCRQSINVKPGVFGKHVMFSRNPIWREFLARLDAAGIKVEVANASDSAGTLSVGQLLMGGGRPEDLRAYGLQGPIRSGMMPIQEVRSIHNIVYTWAGALFLGGYSSDNPIAESSAFFQAIRDIWESI